MWAIRILTGQQAGQIYPLKNGKNKLGRSTQCDIQLPDNGISKEHLEINVLSDKVLLADLNSSNGTFLNGIRIQGGLLKFGDKFSVYQVICDLIQVQESLLQGLLSSARDAAQRPRQIGVPVPMSVPLSAPLSSGGTGLSSSMPVPKSFSLETSLEKLQLYFDQVVMPGVYKLTLTFEFKMIVMGFIGIFILMMTFLSVIPMKQITSESISNESRRRALTVARSLALANEKIIRSNEIASFDTQMVLREEGIDDVYIVSREGKIISPPERAGMQPKEIGFVKKLKGQTKEVTDEFSGLIGAGVPILVYDAEIQQNIAKAYAVIIYNPGTLAFDEGRALSLYIQMLSLGVILGLVIFFVLNRLIEYPMLKLNSELDQALKENKDHIEIPIRFPAFQQMMTGLNSLLVRAAQGVKSAEPIGNFSREVEMGLLSEMIGYPCLILTAEGRMIKCNRPFQDLLNVSAGQIENQPVQQFPDQAVQKNITELMEQARSPQENIFFDQIEVGGHNLKVSCHSLRNPHGQAEYFIITFSQDEEAQAA